MELFAELEQHIADLEGDEAVNAVVIRGAGRCFSAGNDLGAIAGGTDKVRPNFQAQVIERLANLPQPVIAGVHGHCFTGALELALASDIIVAAESARFADTHARFAMSPVWGMSQRLPRRIGTYRAREMMFTCRTVPGSEAAAIGLASQCVPDDQLDAELARLAGVIASLSPYSHRANKRLLMATDGMGLNEGLAHEIYRSAGRGPDMLERIAAFQNRK